MVRRWVGRAWAWLAIGRRWVAWLTISIVSFPPLMASIAVAAYLSSSGRSNPASGGGSLALGLWLGLPLAIIIGWLSLIFITAERANPYEYREITNRMCELEAEFERLGANKAKDAIRCGPQADKMFADQALRWVAGHGYLNLWTEIHEAEQALFIVEDIDWLATEANRDLLRLKDSKLPQADAFVTEINGVVKAATWDNLARMTLRKVRTGLNEYRQTLWDQLVRARNQFLRTLIATSVLTAIVVDLIIVRGTDPLMVLVASVLYLVGVLVGLFGRLQGLIGSTSVEEDFGLDTAHLLAVPILSGIAAVLGVLLVGLLKLKIGDINIGSPSFGPNESALRAILNLGANPGALIIAGLFGLTPELLIRYLKTQADSFAKGLSTTETWGKSPTVP